MDLYAIAELARLAVDLYTVMEVFFKGSAVEDTIACGVRVVEDELLLGGELVGGSLRLIGVRSAY